MARSEDVTPLAGWLHKVAHRVAIQANTAAARRRTLERQVGQMAVATSTNGPAASDELLPALHEEIARLPEKYRLAVVHCDLEGMTQAQAAEQLHWSERTIHHRLAEGRARLRRRLARRGLAPTARRWARCCCARRGPPYRRLERSDRSCRGRHGESHDDRRGRLGGGSATGSGGVQGHVAPKAHMGISHSAGGRPDRVGGVGRPGLARSGGPEGGDRATGTCRRPTADTAVPRPKPGSADTAGTFPVRGRVLDPDGKPVAGAGVYVRHYAETRWSELDPMAARQKGRVAETDADGWFHFELDKGASDGSYYSGETGWHKAQIAVAAPGFAPAWVEAGDMVKLGEIALRLVRDDVPVRGRVLDSQGRPVAGVAVRIRAIWEVNDGVDLDAMLASGAVDENMSRMVRRYGRRARPAAPTWQADPAPLWPGGRNAWTTGADGRFEVRGIGRDRIARLEFHGGGVADGTLDVMARPAKAPLKARPLPSLAGGGARRAAKPRSWATTRRGRSLSARPSITSPARPSRSSAPFA